MENAADSMYGSLMMKEDKDQYIANLLNAMDQDFLSKFHQKMNSSTSSSSSSDSNEMFEKPKLKNMKLEAVQSEEINMVKKTQKILKVLLELQIATFNSNHFVHTYLDGLSAFRTNEDS